MNRTELFDKAKRESEALSKEFPESPTIRSIVHQIDYLSQLAKGTTNDRSRLKEIVIGIQAAREIEPLNLELAKLLYEVDAEAGIM